MALFFANMSCPLCGEAMAATDARESFAAFVADPDDPMQVFSDATMHMACLERHPLTSEARRWHTEVLRAGAPTARNCAACTKTVLHPDDYFGTGVLTRDPRHPLYEFNFVHLHRSCAGAWPRFAEFQRRMAAQQGTKAYRGPMLVDDHVGGPGPRWRERSGP